MTSVEIPQNEDTRILGTDGVRGDVGSKFINPNVFAGLGFALTRELMERGHNRPRIAVGRDPRESSPLLMDAVMSGILEAGGGAIDLGVAPTPAVQRVAQEEADVAGFVMVTASHNPKRENGLKLGENALKLTGDAAWSLTRRFWQQEHSGLVIPTSLDDRRRIETRPDAHEKYISDIVSSIRKTFKSETPLADTLFVVDCANGAAMDISPEVFERLGAEVIRFACDPSGGINDNCGSEHLKGLKSFLAAHPEITGNPKFVGAIAHDGDADRGNGIGFFGGKLWEVTGSHILEALAQHPDDPKDPEPGVVGNPYINSASEERIRALGVDFKRCDNGDIAVTQMLRKLGWRRGAEHSAHNMLMSWLTSGDGTYAMARYAAWAVTVQKKTFGQIVSELPLYPSQTVNVSTNGYHIPESIGDDPVMVAAGTEQLEKLGGGKGRVLLRPSGTQPLMRAMIEVPGASEEAIIASATYLGNLAVQRIKELERVGP